VHADIAARRLLNQRLTRPEFRRPCDVIAWFGAMQAQEFESAKWALALRMREGTAGAEIQRAFDQGRILRTHAMRPTWHFVTPADIRWLVELTAPRVHRAMATYRRRFGLDAALLTRGTSIIESALADRRYLTRRELSDQLRQSGLALDNFPLALLMMYAEFEGVICSGPRRGRQFTYALTAERAPGAARLSRDEAVATLCRRYFRSHGPATIRDFVWWSGLTTADARRGLEMIRARHEDVDGLKYWSVNAGRGRTTRDDLVHLLPIYDEYVVSYRDRHPVPYGPPGISAGRKLPVVFQHALVIAGQVAGTWRTSRNSGRGVIDAYSLRPLTRREQRALSPAVERYARFLGESVRLGIRD
jgi:hypothetical protein